jgi:hypothetical protein
MSLAQLSASIAAASSNLMVSANAEDHKAIGRTSIIDRIGFMD